MIRLVANKKQSRVCALVHDSGYCPKLCQKHGGCFMPELHDSVAELKRKCFRPDAVLTFYYMNLQQEGGD